MALATRAFSEGKALREDSDTVSGGESIAVTDEDLIGKDSTDTWNITELIKEMLRKLREAPSEKRLAIIDWWMGQLLSARAAIQAGSWPGEREKVKKR